MKKALLLGIVFVILCLTQASAQNNINGVVKDDSDLPVTGATIVVKGTSSFSTTDIAGQFNLSVKEDFPFTVSVNIIGYRPQEIQVYELPEEPLHISLQADNLLDEVVIVGYGTQERRNLVGSIAKISTAQLAQLKTIPGVFVDNNTLSTINLGSKFTSPLADFKSADNQPGKLR